MPSLESFIYIVPEIKMWTVKYMVELIKSTIKDETTALELVHRYTLMLVNLE